MDRAAAEREALRLWRNLPLQERLSPNQAIAFAAMIAPTLDFEEPEKRAKQVERWLLRDLPRSHQMVDIVSGGPGRLVLEVPPWPQREGASAIAFVVSLLVLVARRPDILIDAMLWAEDGAVWFAQAYNDGPWTTLLRIYAGWVQLFPRIVFDVASLLPMRWVPVFAVWVSLIIRAALPAFLFSSRFSWINWRAKIAVAAYYLLMPNLIEVHANITNTSVYLGLYLLAVVVADPPRTPLWKAHDWAALAIAGTTGPFIFFALPLLAFRYRAQRTLASARPLFLAVAVGFAIVQLAALALTMAAGVLQLTQGPNAFGLLQSFAAGVVLGFIMPVRWAGALSIPMVAIPVAIAGVGILVAIFIRGDWKARGLAVVLPLVLLFALYGPIWSVAQATGPSSLASPGRFFVMTSAVWAAVLALFVAAYLPRLPSLALAAVVLICGVLILFEFPLPSVPGATFGPQADRIRSADSGDKIIVPIAPPGWQMTLIKH